MRAGGLRYGVYLSPGDLHEPTYGADSAAYNEFFRKRVERGQTSSVAATSPVWPGIWIPVSTPATALAPEISLVPMAGLEPAGMDHAFRRGFTVGCGRGEDAGSMPVDGF
ncbi:MAG: hypothetical protein RIS76_1990 [Verrucomicrobiota bacterium]